MEEKEEKRTSRYLTMKEFRAEFVSWSDDTLRRRRKTQAFPLVWISGRWLIPRRDAELWFEKMESERDKSA